METRRALLLIADIGGYTDYMQYHRNILGHAEAATARLLEKVIDAARGFELIEIEGDAAFLSREVDGPDDGATLKAVTEGAVAMHRAFHAERRLVQLNMCPCGSCTKTSDLKLKFVAHVGEVAVQTIRRRRNLVGVDVIYVHRLLKNTVQVPEYVLMSEALYEHRGSAADGHPVQEIAQDLEGIGPVRNYVLDVQDLAGAMPPPADPSMPERVGATFGMLGRGLRCQLRLRRPGRAAAAH